MFRKLLDNKKLSVDNCDFIDKQLNLSEFYSWTD